MHTLAQRAMRVIEKNKKHETIEPTNRIYACLRGKISQTEEDIDHLSRRKDILLEEYCRT